MHGGGTGDEHEAIHRSGSVTARSGPGMEFLHRPSGDGGVRRSFAGAAKAHLVFWYDSEVQNGGHGQFLENQGSRRLAETVEALNELGLPEQAVILSRLAAAFRGADEDVDWADILDDGAIDELDDAFHRCAPTVTKALEQHLERHSDEYLETS
jgi:hypothetical protein